MKLSTRTVSFFLIVAGITVGCSDDPFTPTADLSDRLGSSPGNLPQAAAPQMESIDQLLVNADMESTPNAGWWKGYTNETGFDLSYSTAEFVSPGQSLRITSDRDHGSAFAFWGQSVRVTNPINMELTLTAAIKLDQVTGEGVAIAIRGDDTHPMAGSAESFATTQGRFTLDGTEDWQTVQVKLQDMPSDIQTVTVYFILLPHATGTVYFDDAVLSATGATPILSLQNGSVEAGQGYPEHWWAGGYPGFEFSWSTDYSVSPSHSLEITEAGAAANAFGFWAQVIRADDYVAGKLTLSASIMLDGLAGQGIAIAVRADDTEQPNGYAEEFATTQGTVEIVGSAGWREYSVTLGYVPPTAKSITVYLIYMPGTSGTVYFDDITLTPY